jgi:hypothetical protein
LRKGGSMGYVVEIPVEGGGVLRVQGSEDEPPDGLQPAGRFRRGTPPVVRASETVQDVLAGIKPAITATTDMLRAMTPDEMTVEFGLLLGAEGGAIVAKGKAEVHFTVTLTWNRASSEPCSEQHSGAGGDRAAPAEEAATHA